MINIILTYFDISSFRTLSPSLKETMNEKVPRTDIEVQVQTEKKKIVIDENSSY